MLSSARVLLDRATVCSRRKWSVRLNAGHLIISWYCGLPYPYWKRVVSAAWNNQVSETGCDSALEKLSIGVSTSCEGGSRSWQFRAEILVSPALESWKCLSTCRAEDLCLFSSWEAERISGMVVLRKGLSQAIEKLN